MTPARQRRVALERLACARSAITQPCDAKKFVNPLTSKSPWWGRSISDLLREELARAIAGMVGKKK